MLFDTHCHLDAQEFADDRDAVMHAARAAGVAKILIPAVETKTFQNVRDCCSLFPGCLPAYGIHPLYADRASESDIPALREWMRREQSGTQAPVAVGEIGLDFHVANVDAVRQEFFFVEQLKIAREFDLPVVLHVRRAIDPVLKFLRRTGSRKGIAHAFNGSRQQADAFISLGFKLGFGGAMTYPGSRRIRQLAATLPLEAIVLETDAPDIPPVWLAGERNTPAQLQRIAQVLADLRGQSIDAVIEATAHNAHALFHENMHL